MRRRHDGDDDGDSVQTDALTERTRDSTVESSSGHLPSEVPSSPLPPRQQSSSGLSSPGAADASATRSVSSSSSMMRSGSSLLTDHKESIRLAYVETARNVNVESLTANKLRFASLGLIGRDKETAILKQRLEPKVDDADDDKGGDGPDSNENGNCSDKSGCRELVFISGFSGTGKTALACTLARRVKGQKGLYLSGKFDLYLRDEPYLGIAAACRELCGEILVLQQENQAELYEEIRGQIITELGDEIRLLINIVPDLEEIVGPQDDPSSVNGRGNASSSLDEVKESFNYAFRKFMLVASAHFCPLVIALDDLQWADVASLELVETLITDRANPNSLMIVGCYRSNEVDDAHFLSKTMRDLHERKEKDSFEITDIPIGNLSVSDVNRIIVALLSVDSEKSTLGLAEICHKRTLGNAFHLVTFLSMLHEAGLLEFHVGLFQWKWDVARIEEETAATANVVDLMKEKMNKQPETVSQLLQLASCLGSSFDEKTLLLVWESFRTTDAKDDGKALTKDALLQLVSQAVEDAFLEAHGPSRYRWVHDKVQEAAMSLIAEEELASFQLQVGGILLEQLSEKELDAAVFVVANLLKNEHAMPSEKRATIAQLNLRAAEKAIEFSAFESAAKHAKRGIDLLSTDRWTSQQKLSLELYSICTEANFCLGNLDDMQMYCEEVLNQKKLPVTDKLRVYDCLIHTIGNGGRANEAINILLDVLGQLGCKFPRNAVVQTFKALAWLGKTKLPTKEVTASLPLMMDPTKKSCMMLMDNLATYAHYASNIFVFVLAASRMVRWTIRYGMSEYSPSAFALLGITKVVGGESQLAGEFAEHALLLLDKLKSKRPEARTTYLSWFMIFPWTRPLQSTLSHLLKGYKAGMETGDTESAMWNVSTYILAAFMSGRSLHSLDVDCRTYLVQMQELSQEEIWTTTLPFWQGMLNLMGRSENTVILTGEAMDENEFNKMALSMQSRRTYLHGQIFKSFMCTYFGEHELGAELALKRGDAYGTKDAAAAPLAMPDAFHRGFALFAVARKTKNRSYTRHARKITSNLKSLAKQGNPNVTHYVALLDAENAVLVGDTDQASELYFRAVITAARSGFVQDAALANERFGEFLLYKLEDKESAAFRMEEAVRLYSVWGADRKADMLREKHCDLWSAPAEINLVESSTVSLHPETSVSSLHLSS